MAKIRLLFKVGDAVIFGGIKGVVVEIENNYGPHDLPVWARFGDEHYSFTPDGKFNYTHKIKLLKKVPKKEKAKKKPL